MSIHALNRVQEAFQACLQRDEHLAQELLLYTRNELKRFTGDLPIVGHTDKDAPFLTGTFAEAQVWGWLEYQESINCGKNVPVRLSCISSERGGSGVPGI